MTLKTLALASAASLALCAGANGAWAQQTDPSQYSSPAEQAQTQQLNAQNADGVDASPQELNGQGAPDQGPNQGYDNSQQPSAQQDQYNQQLQTNQQQQMQYQQQSAQYQAQYGDNPPPPAGYERTSYPRAPVYEYSGKLWTLGRIEDPTHQLAQLPIEGPDGRWVGKVRNVDLDVGGVPRRIEVALDPNHSVWVPPSHFKYDAHNRVLFTDLSYDQLWNHPGATWESDEP